MKSKTAKPHKRKITLAMYLDGAPGNTIRKEVRATVVGAFAYFEDENSLWNISHVPTGGFLFNAYSEADAKAAIAFMSEGLDWNWGAYGETRYTEESKRKHYNRAKAAQKKWHTSEVSL